MSSTAAPLIEPTPLAFRRSPRTALAFGIAEWVTRRWRRAVVGVALDRDRRADTGVDRPHHVDDSLSSGAACFGSVAVIDGRRRLGRPTVDPHVPSAACVGRLGARLAQPDRPQPAVDPYLFRRRSHTRK